MNHEVFVCYDSKDEEIASDISNLFELNNIKTWLKSRDYGENDTVYTITQAIENSKCVVLVYSKNSKNSNFVITEIDIAFSSEIQILIYKIDDSPIDGKLEFYLKDKPLIESLNPKEKYSALLKDVSNILNRPVGEEMIIASSPDVQYNHVFICYSDEDEEIANAICHVLEKNRIRCWIKNRDLGVNDTVHNLTENIELSDAVVLIHSSDSEKSNYTKTESQIAMSENIPIILYKIDNYTINSKLKEYVGKNRLDAHPDINSELENLVKTTSEVLNNPVERPVVNEIPQKEKKTVPENKSTVPASRNESSGANEIKGFIKIGIIVLIIIFIMLVIWVFSNAEITTTIETSESLICNWIFL